MPTAKRERMLRKFQEQLQFLELSCQAYDRGSEIEAIRIATSLRIFFHDTGASTSLISHLKIGNKKMLSSGSGQGSVFEFLGWQINLASSEPVKTRPRLGDKFREVSITEWWSAESIFLYGTQKYPRRKVILSAANRDGGAHVDELERFYEALSEGLGEGLSITGNLEFDGKPPFEQGVTQSAKNVHLALIRQFAHELFASVNYFAWLK